MWRTSRVRLHPGDLGWFRKNEYLWPDRAGIFTRAPFITTFAYRINTLTLINLHLDDGNKVFDTKKANEFAYLCSNVYEAALPKMPASYCFALGDYNLIYLELENVEDYNRLRKRIGAENVVDKPAFLLTMTGDIDELADAALERSNKVAAILGVSYARAMLAPLSDMLENVKTDAEKLKIEDIASNYKIEDIAVLLDKGKVKADADVFDALMMKMGRDVQEARRPLDGRIAKAAENYLKSVVEVEVIGAALLGTKSLSLGAALGVAAGRFLGPLGVAVMVGNLIYEYRKEKKRPRQLGRTSTMLLRNHSGNTTRCTNASKMRRRSRYSPSVES